MMTHMKQCWKLLSDAKAYWTIQGWAQPACKGNILLLWVNRYEQMWKEMNQPVTFFSFKCPSILTYRQSCTFQTNNDTLKAVKGFMAE